MNREFVISRFPVFLNKKLITIFINCLFSNKRKWSLQSIKNTSFKAS